MAEVKEKRRRMTVLAHHGKPLTDEFLSDAFCRWDTPRWTPEFARRTISDSRELDDLRGGIGVVFPHPSPVFAGQEVAITVVLRQSSGFQLSNGVMASTPALDRERDRWLRVATTFKEVSHTNDLHAQWFLAKVAPFLAAFAPEFVCADTDVAVAERSAEQPEQYAWPLAYYGPRLVSAIGREKLLSTPAWEVKEIEGGIWVQASRNPFASTPIEVARIGEHLGLKTKD